ncbi:hypothetical protein [Arthrobacter bambusae]|uniref:hypothetical protein n=1 Tax=Arthrobacter bambusae TaxID=1338426 RepID=UPI002783F6ED|nr:hypothetical protein [Arthrobacter bambusae]MDQ0028785.1 hypothetical protein [Arthrobacter bambusae]MDQ0096421.1 hypothetical protein [Arthrobacter bambusae]
MGAETTIAGWNELGPRRASKAARDYAALGDRSRVQRASTLISGVVSLTTASLAGMVLGRGTVVALAGTERAYRVLRVFRTLLFAALGLALGTLPAVVVPDSYSFATLIALEVLIACWILAVVPSLKFHRERGLRLNGRRWKKCHGVIHLWIVCALANPPGTTVDELETALRTLVPGIGPGSAAIVFAVTDAQVQALQRLGYTRDSETTGLMYRTAARASATEPISAK